MRRRGGKTLLAGSLAGAVAVAVLVGTPEANASDRSAQAQTSHPGHDKRGRGSCRQGDRADRDQQELYGLSERHASDRTSITAANAASLREAWRLNTAAPVSHAPLVHRGTVYVADWSGTVYAADARTGKLRWKRTIAKPMTKWPWHGLAATGEIANGTLYEVSVEGRLYALDLRSGRTKWSRSITRQQYAGALAPPQYFNHLLYVGLESVAEPLSKMKGKSFDPRFRGMVEAFDADTGRLVWTRATVRPPKNGVAVWGGFAVDPALCAVYFGTGNNYSGKPSPMSDSLVAVNAMTGRVLWYDQTWTHDVWLPVKPIGPDWDYGNAPQLFTVHRNGRAMRAVGIGNKSGLYMAFDARTGKPLWHTVVGYGSVGGGIRWEASLGHGVIYASSNNNYADSNPAQFPLSVKALDMNTGAIRWARPKVQHAIGSNAGFRSRDVLLIGDATGTIQGYRTSDGSTVASFTAPGPVAASLNVVGDTLFVGTGLPAAFGGGPNGNGLVAYRPSTAR